MANPYINKVYVKGVLKIDLTGDTVDEAHLLSGRTAHDRSGAPITGVCTYDADTTDANAEAADILEGKTAYCSGTKLEGTMKNIGGIEKKITSRDYIVMIGEGYHDGSGNVTIAQEEKDKLVSENIKSGITILGVTGNYEGSGGSGGLPSTITAGNTPVWADMTTHTDTTASGQSVYSFTCKKQGTYRIYAPVSSNNSTCTASIRKNGTVIKSAAWEGVSIKRDTIQTDVEMSAGDNITVYIKGVSSTRGVSSHGLVVCIDWDNGI